MSCLEAETGRGSLWGSPWSRESQQPPPIKVVVSLLGHYFILRNSRLFFFCNYVGWIVNFVIWRKSTFATKLFATKYCFLILGDDTSFFFFISLFFVLFYVIINIYKNYFIILLLLLLLLLLLFHYFFHENNFYFFMFGDVPGFSGMFRHVPECSEFRILSTPNKMTVLFTRVFIIPIQLKMQKLALDKQGTKILPILCFGKPFPKVCFLIWSVHSRVVVFKKRLSSVFIETY